MNVIYKRQLSILIFFAGLVFKISFLPVHITNAAANNNIVIILAYMIFDFALLGLVYYIIKNKAVQSLPKSFATFLMILLYIWF
ncbi:MAG: hypothetical protein LBQ27_06550, partial [Clostridiales bacterium]|nr:hypothetical protein [Clostridiales bacterium]